jgi:hypothetical protein
MKTFRPYDPEQMLPLPPSIQEWLPENHLARFVSDWITSVLDGEALHRIQQHQALRRALLQRRFLQVPGAFR